MSETTQLLDLPVDILYLIFPYLDVTSFVALTSTCSALHQPDIAQYAPYWSLAARNTFRVPNQPVVENDGLRWQKMYRRLLTESRCFTWGNNDRTCLGHSQQTHMGAPFGRGGIGPAGRRRPIVRTRQHVSWPTEMENVEQLGIIADMQCGGWSTNLLTSKGGLYSVGVMDGIFVGQPAKSKPERLRYPAGLPHPNERYEPASAIKQFSAGRRHVLALSDAGYIWSWSHINMPALQVKFLNVDTVVRENAGPSTRGYVKKVVAGWAKSAALVVGTGIVLWEPLTRGPRQPEGEEDAVLVLETAICPGTDYQKHTTSFQPSPASSSIGEVQNFICLEHYIVFNTHLGKVYAAKIVWDAQSKALDDVRELPLQSEGETKFATDVQGSFRSFAIFTNDGNVYTGNQDDHLHLLFHPLPNDGVISLNRISALQQSQVISIAFGDYHFHALHAPGYITSYGTEPQSCGCLGLGGHGDPDGRIRGLRYQGIGGDGRLVPHASLHGRRIWFETEKQKWITFLASGGRDPEEARERMRMLSELKVQGEVSEWIEQEGNAWEQRYARSTNAQGDDDLATYFALSVTAAGWHSGALVLVNEDKAKRISEACLAAADDDSEEDTMTNEEDDAQGDQVDNRGLLNRALDYAGDLVRWFNGSPRTDTAGPSFRDPNDPNAFVNPQNHGAVAEDGRSYVWAQDSFPRLRLASGEDMPGEIEFSEWRSGRPEWEGKIEGY
ncbi:hypothetical protein E4T48_03911 [Aureobasidium sp. EXF-10727]|nr:hypothetical protein E4T48_03911 [Aureobasidium sp. EXF-10727]